MHPFERFRQNLLVKFYSMNDFNFLTHELKQRKTLVWVLLLCETLDVSNFAMCSQTSPCALEAIMRTCLCFQIKRLLGSDT